MCMLCKINLLSISLSFLGSSLDDANDTDGDQTMEAADEPGMWGDMRLRLPAIALLRLVLLVLLLRLLLLLPLLGP